LLNAKLNQKIPDPPSYNTLATRGHRTTKQEDDWTCGVCNDGDYDDDDLIVICNRCDMGVHMKCYGIL